MKPTGLLASLALGLVVMGVCSANSVLAASPPAASGLRDVALWEGGVLVGQLVDARGVGRQAERVTLILEQRQVAVAESDLQGRFIFRGLQGGLYQLAASEGVGTFRLWNPGTAPPVAESSALLVTGNDLVRGQYQYHSSAPDFGNSSPSTWEKLKLWHTDPWIAFRRLLRHCN